MHLDYSDILSRLGKPLWHDSNGVPRYEPFTPRAATVYGDYVALLEIGCQACTTRMIVAKVWMFLDALRILRAQGRKDISLAPGMPNTVSADPWTAIGSFHYGDPPRHNREDGEFCHAGSTMNSIPIRVIEFWSRRRHISSEWVRQPEYELEMPPFVDE